MSLSPGTRLGPYEVVGPLGAGGMGEVYRARDTNLDRDVALKILPDSMAGDAERLERFQREAKTLAALNHPNIAQVYGLEGDGATRAIVMELVEGRTLEDAIGGAGLPLEEALPIARQIAAALETAHEQGVIHRDLKPANVMLTADDQVKVLDFGLAKAMDPTTSSDNVANSPTMTARATQAGMIVGTAAYMSPEQARGKSVDKRADIWAFGCVLHELIVGKPTFGGETVTDVLASVVRATPDWDALGRVAPPRLSRLVQRCLRKDPRERLRDIGDAALTLDEIADGDDGTPAADAGSTGDVSVVTVARGPWKSLTVLFALAALALAVALFMIAGRGGSGPGAGDADAGGQRVAAMTLLTDFAGLERAPSLSPDGRQLLYVAEDGGDLDIFLLRAGGQNAVNLTARFSSDDDHPAWSPDGERIAFDSNRDGGGIFVMGATGESPLRVSDDGFHPAWAPDGTRLMFSEENITDVYSRTKDARLQIVDVESGDRSVVPVDLDAVEGQWSPDGRFIAYWTADAGTRDIHVVGADGATEFVNITDDAATDWGPRWAPDGRSLFFVSDRGGSPDLWRISIDPANGRPTGEPRAVTTGVARVSTFSLSADGRRIALGIAGKKESLERIAFDPRNERPLGEAETIFASANGIEQFSLSRDEQWIAFRAGSFQEDLYTLRVDGTERRRLTDDAARDRGPEWGPNDDWIVFYSNRAGDYEHWLISRDGTGLRRIAGHPTLGMNDVMWSSDGTRLGAILGGSGTTIYDVDPRWLEPASSFEPIEAAATLPDFSILAWSPDDRYLFGCAASTLAGDEGIVELASGEVTLIRREDGTSMPCHIAVYGDWLDRSRVIFWDESRDRAVLYDVAANELRAVPGVPGPSSFRVADEGRLLYMVRKTEDEEIWMLTFEGD